MFFLLSVISSRVPWHGPQYCNISYAIALIAKGNPDRSKQILPNNSIVFLVKKKSSKIAKSNDTSNFIESIAGIRVGRGTDENNWRDVAKLERGMARIVEERKQRKTEARLITRWRGDVIVYVSGRRDEPPSVLDFDRVCRISVWVSSA